MGKVSIKVYDTAYPCMGSHFYCLDISTRSIVKTRKPDIFYKNTINALYEGNNKEIIKYSMWDNTLKKKDIILFSNKIKKICKYNLDELKVYFLLSIEDGLVKIGYSKNIEKRLKAIKITKNDYFILTLNGGQVLEKMLHDFFCDYRWYGEWFIFNEDISFFIDQFTDKGITN